MKDPGLLLRYRLLRLYDQDDRVEYISNELGRQPQSGPSNGETMQAMNTSAMSSFEQAHDDPMVALQRARELIAASVCKDFSLSWCN